MAVRQINHQTAHKQLYDVTVDVVRFPCYFTSNSSSGASYCLFDAIRSTVIQILALALQFVYLLHL